MDEHSTINRGQLRDIVEHFYKQPVTPEALTEYCNLKGYDVITPGALQDWTFQYESDNRVATLLPAVFTLIAKFKPVPELLADEKRKAILDENETIAVDICKLLEDHGVLYQEIDLVTKNIGAILASILNDAGTRANNMAATMLAHAAHEKWGETLTVKTLGEAYRAVAKEKGEKELAQTKQDTQQL